MKRRLFVAATMMLTAACATTARSGMPLALEPSMERMQATEQYLRTVAGPTGDAFRMSRGDGYVYMTDVAPTLRYLALTGDSLGYRRLRGFVATSMIRRDASGARPYARARAGAPFEDASPYAALRLGEALAIGWSLLGDTASAVLSAQLRPVPALAARPGSVDALVEECVSAEARLATETETARAVLQRRKDFRGGFAIGEQSALGLRDADADLVVMSCLTRLGVAVNDPDATVRFLDRMLGRLSKMVNGSGRPDFGVTADVMLTLKQAEARGPKYLPGK
jgi:hypothetical protein